MATKNIQNQTEETVVEGIKTLVVDDWVLADDEVVEVKIVGNTIEIRTKRGIRIPGTY